MRDPVTGNFWSGPNHRVPSEPNLVETDMSSKLHEDPSDVPEVEERYNPGRTTAPRTEQIRRSFPRRHDILWHREVPRYGSHFLAKDLSAFECFQVLRKEQLFRADEPRLEVHFVDKERNLEVMEASRWIQKFKKNHSKDS